jgi:hypothetical protein
MDKLNENKTTTPPFESKLETIGETSGNSSTNTVNALDAEKDPAITGLREIDQYDLTDLLNRKELLWNVRTRKAYRKRVSELSKVDSEEKTKSLIDRRKKVTSAKREMRQAQRGIFKPAVFTESHVVGEMNVGAPAVSDVKENVTEHAGEIAEQYSAGEPSHDSDAGLQTEYDLSKFFERPVTIYDSTWTSNTEQNVILNPWALWSSDSAVRAKLSNYAFFKGDLHVKVSTTGTPYHYGRVMLSYQPYADQNDNLTQYDELLAATVPPTADVLPPYKCYLSQAPGIAYVDVKENTPVEMKLPFISYKNCHRLYNNASTVITNAVDFEDMFQAGELRMVTLNKIGVANDDYDSFVSLNVYAWVTNIELGCITGTDIDITAESKTVKTSNFNKSMRGKPMYDKSKPMGTRVMNSLEKVGDEYSSPGPVTQVASAVSKAGSALQEIPIIGPFAKATSTIANAVGRVASLFGWGRPIVMSNPTFVKNQPYQNGANTTGFETSLKLTVDPKQELSVDPLYGGVAGIDDMAIQTISARESYVHTFTWADTDVAMTDVLYTAQINPAFNTGLTSLPNASYEALIQPTALMFAALPFVAWRGNIKIRFEFVCSKFHRGKVLIKYDPNHAQHTLISSSSTKLNQQNAIIVDLQDTQDITIEVDWASDTNWKRIGTPSVRYPNADNAVNTASFGQYFDNEVNGWLEVRVLNELVQPTTTSTVSVNVYVSCDDLQVNRMSGLLLPTVREVSRTESKVVETINQTGAGDSAIALDNYGERITSFRSLMKRYTSQDIEQLTAGVNGLGWIRFRGNHYPPLGVPYQDTLSVDQSHHSATLYSYLRYAYMGIRGGMRHRINFNTESNVRNCDLTQVTLNWENDWSQGTALDATLATTTARVVGVTPDENFLTSMDGTVTFHHVSNGGVEFETPFYSNMLWLFSFTDGFYNFNLPDFDIYGTNYFECKVMCDQTTSDRTVVVHDIATAEDFTFLRFQGAPFWTDLAGG